jgi:hypothetical protein
VSWDYDKGEIRRQEAPKNGLKNGGEKKAWK